MILNVYKDLSSNYYFRSNTIFQAFPKKQIGQTTGKNHMVVCIQKNWLGHKVLMRKMLVQTDHPSLTYKPKRDGFVCRKPNRHVFAHISG